MNSTIAHEEGISVVKKRAFGYERDDHGWLRKDQSITSAVLGDGGIYSNVEDMRKWDQSLYSDYILSDDLRKESMTRAVLTNGDKIDYGYGWHLKTYRGAEIVYHGGSTQGFRNVIYRIPSKQFTIIILTNRNEGEPEKIADKIFDIYDEE
jgi:CubicO group peptidase (beta-lactamase class C family)